MSVHPYFCLYVCVYILQYDVNLNYKIESHLLYQCYINICYRGDSFLCVSNIGLS